MTNKIQGPALFAPLAAYQEFANHYGCFTTPLAPAWEKELAFDKHTRLCLRGLNSALVSSDKDGQEPKNQLLVGEYQSTHLSREGVTYLSMCHHPPRWLIDEDNFNKCTLAPGRVAIQLFGHEHEFQVQDYGSTLRLYAGAMHPSRAERAWLPRYNVIILSVVDSNQDRLLTVELWAQAWNDKAKRFESDGNYCKGNRPFAWQVRIGPSPIAGTDDNPPGVSERAVHGTTENNVADLRVDQMDAEQQLVSSFILLPYHRIVEIAVELGLLRDEDEDVDTIEQYRRYFQRARERVGGFGDLWNAVARFDSSLASQPNPFQRKVDN